MPEVLAPSYESPEGPPQSGLEGEAHDRLVDQQFDVMRGWLDDIRPLSKRGLKGGAHVKRAGA